MRLLAPTRMLTLQIQNGCTWRDTCVSKLTGKAGEDTNGNATIAIQVEETQELFCVSKDGEGSTFTVRSLLQKTGWPPTNKEFRARDCRNAVRDIRMRQSKGPSKNNHELQHGICAKMFTPRDVP